jgi:hypothetical protein
VVVVAVVPALAAVEVVAEEAVVEEAVVAEEAVAEVVSDPAQLNKQDPRKAKRRSLSRYLLRRLRFCAYPPHRCALPLLHLLLHPLHK